MNGEKVGAARERLVSDEELTAELLWHVHYDDYDEQIPCDICCDSEVPCIVERLIIDLREARTHIKALEAALRGIIEGYDAGARRRALIVVVPAPTEWTEQENRTRASAVEAMRIVEGEGMSQTTR